VDDGGSLNAATPRVLPGADAFRFQGDPLGFFLQHGFTGCPASMRPFGEWLHERGHSVAAARLPGHGTTWEDLETTKWTDWERESESVLSELRSHCSTVIAVGLSMGGAMAIHLAVRHPDQIDGVVSINTLIRRPDLMFSPLARLVMRTVKGVGNDIKKPGQDEIVYDRIPLKGANELGKLLRVADRDLPSLRQPLVVCSSPEDHTVKPGNSKRVYDRAGSERKEFVTLANSYHVATLDYDAETLFEKTLELGRSLAGATEGASGS
jgi:carboxylesterase